MRARQIEVFSAVMRAGTITAAARLLNISQPALSQILLHTEDELGFALFERTRGRLTPTQEALALFPDVEHLVVGLENLRRRANDLRLGRLGYVCVAASAPLALTIIPEAFRLFRAAHAEVPMRSLMTPIQEALNLLRRDEAAIGVALDDLFPPDIVVEALGRIPFLCLLPKAHPLTEKDQVELTDLMDQKLIRYRTGTRQADELEKVARARNLVLPFDIEIDVSLSAAGFVRAGLGIAIVDALLPWKSFDGLDTRPLRQSPTMPLTMITLQGRPMSIAEEAMGNAIRQSVAGFLVRV
jgi:DNA-binding transcriptional LysR family regulator